MKRISYISFIIISLFTFILPTKAQDTESDANKIIIQPLFEYPTPPAEMTSLQERCDWLIEHFWEPMDFKNKTTVDQNALNHAFGVYAAAMMHADSMKVDEAVDKLISQISKNPAMSIQFAKASEEALYGPRADYWIDSVFLKFVENIIKSKGIKKERKERYEKIYKSLSNSIQGKIPPEFDYITPEGKTSHYHPNGIITVIEFGTPDCFDCRMSKLKLDTDVKFNSLIDKGKINVLYINPSPESGWEETMKDFPKKWHVGAAKGIDEIYDLRLSPALYVIDREGKVAVKNVNVETAMRIAIAAAEN